MKKEIRSTYEIKLDFDSTVENPSRLFQSFADLIESVTTIDKLVAQSVDTSISSKVYLDDIEKGSLIAKLWNELVVSEDGKLDNATDEQAVQEYIEESRAESLEFIANEKSSVEDLENLSDKISEIAEEKKLDKTFNYAKLDILEIAKSLNNVNESIKKLTENESFILKSPNREVKEIKSGTPKIDIEAVENALTEQEIVNESEIFYKIKKPDFLGDSQWDFKHGNKTVKVKILHEEWL